MRLLGKILSAFICILAVVIIVGVFLMFALSKDGDISNIVWTKEALDAYKEMPEDFTVEYYSEYEEHYFTEDGYFSVSKIRYIPSISQWQMTVRYNKSTLKYLTEDYGIEFKEGDDHFTFALKDDRGKVYRNFRYIKEIKGRYTYYRLLFDDVEIMDVNEVKLYVYIADEVQKDKHPEEHLGSLPVYYSDLPRDLYDHKDELPEDMKPTASLKDGAELLK